MDTIIVASAKPYTGKSGICLALLKELAERGRYAGYFKPFGTMPVEIEGLTTDKDAAYINSQLVRPALLETVCPVVKTRALVEEVMSGRVSDLSGTVRRAFDLAEEGRDVMVVEGPSDAFQGMAVDLDVCKLAGLLDAEVLVVDRPRGVEFPDDVLGVCDCLGDRLVGAVFNWVHESQEAFVRDHVSPFLRMRGIEVFGSIPQDVVLGSVTVREIVEGLSGTVLSAEERLDEPVESFMVGAMGQDKALRFFRRKARKAVVTGGDRSDVQLAALETSTRCVVLTGNLPPSSLVLSRAEELGVPMVMVDMDTLSAVERLERLFGQTRLHDPAKAARIRQMFQENVDVDGLLRAFRIS